MTQGNKPREFWVYQNEEHGSIHCCDFNQRGFLTEKVHNPIHTIEYSVLEAEREKSRKLVDLVKTYASYMKTANYHQMSDEMIMKLKEIEEV